MKIVLATFGSRGDVQPMLALSLALQRAGHGVLLAAPPEKGAWARRLGCPFTPLGERVLLSSDEAISSAPPDAKPNVFQTGYLHLDQDDRHSAALETFLNAGPPPLYAGFGSMPQKDQKNNIPVMVETARSAERRIVIAKYRETPSTTPEGDVFFIGNYPHLKLFPRMAAVIHHGGAGTVAAGAASGIPQIVVPHILDQYYWGNRIYRSRLGPEPIWRSRLTARKLARAIDRAVSDQAMKQKAEAVAGMISPRESLNKAIHYLLMQTEPEGYGKRTLRNCNIRASLP